MPSYQNFHWLKWENSKQRVLLENSFKQRNNMLIGSLGVPSSTPNAKEFFLESSNTVVVISDKKKAIINCLKRLKYFHISSLFESLICLVFRPLWDRSSLVSQASPQREKKFFFLFLDLHKSFIFCPHFLRRRTIKILYF